MRTEKIRMTLNGLWDRFRSTDIKKAKRIGVSACALLVGTFLLGGMAGIRINASPSLPIGLYATTADPKAELVEFCPPEPYASLAIRRGYRTKGVCRDGATPLLKPIAAREGDWVEVSLAGVRVNGRLLPNSVPRPTDTSGRPMPTAEYPAHRVGPGMIWVVSTYNARSFDSRYFGPISDQTITAKLRPFIVAK